MQLLQCLDMLCTVKSVNNTLQCARSSLCEAHLQPLQINFGTWGIMEAFVLLIHPFITMPSLE